MPCRTARQFGAEAPSENIRGKAGEFGAVAVGEIVGEAGHVSIGWGTRGGGGVPVALLGISLLVVSLDFALLGQLDCVIALHVLGLK